MRNDFTSHAVTEETQKNNAFNALRTTFSKAMLKRFHEIKGAIEDIWDLVASMTALRDRLKTIAAKEGAWTTSNLIDMALICCILWNNTDDEQEDFEE